MRTSHAFGLQAGYSSASPTWRGLLSILPTAIVASLAASSPLGAAELVNLPCTSHAADKGESKVVTGSEIKAFPTAEGFARFARGGRGGDVYVVTTLADGGPGSLRECAEATGPRTCVFQVSGTIEVDDWINIQSPYLTIAGQTSPGGIALKVRNSMNSPMLIQTHDVVVRFLRLRPGPSPRPSENVDTIQISGGAENVILDHLSTSWPTDEGINIIGSAIKGFRGCNNTRDVTVQWSILSEGLSRANRGPHSRGTYFGYGAESVSFHHNLIASNTRRNPLVNNKGQFDFINNVIYNSGIYNAEFYTRFGDLAVNALGNIGIVGPSTIKTSQIYLMNYFKDFPAAFSIYLKGNIDLHRRDEQADEKLVLEPDDRRLVSSAPLGAISIPPDLITSAEQAYSDVLAYSGAALPKRDSADERVINDVRTCRGAIIDSPQQVGGWPALAGPPAPSDRDHDGMPDDWELAHGLSPDDPADRNGLAAGGYTNLEVYLNDLAGDGRWGAVGSAKLEHPDPTCGFEIKDVGPLPSVELKASPAQVRPGEMSTLTWQGSNIKSCKILGGVAPASGTVTVEPSTTSTYQITCMGKFGGDAIDSVVVVSKASAAPLRQ